MEPLTRAERTNYRETSRYEDVAAFVRDLAARTDKMHVTSFGTSHEGRDLPLLVLSNQKLFTPAQALASGKPIVLVINNIHAGEVEGKEASLILAREMTIGSLQKVLNELVILIVPLFNPDGNERLSPENRKLDLARLEGQIGPDGGVGTRYTTGGLNLNRDYIKQEAVEMVNLTRHIYYTWRPHLTIDCHTTDGSIHAYDLTYGTAMNTAGALEPIEFMRRRFLPTVTEHVFARSGFRTYFYGNWVDEKNPEKGWATYSHKPRYGSNYRGLTNRLDILSEAYSYIPFDRRVAVNREFLLESFELCIKHRKEIIELVERAERETIERGEHPGDSVGIAFKLTPYDEDVEICRRHFAVGIEFDTATGSIRYSGFKQYPEIAKVTTKYHGRFVPTTTVTRPYAYLISRDARNVIDKLRIHDVQVESLFADQEFYVEMYRVKGIEKVPAVDYGTRPREETGVHVERFEGITRFQAGTFIVRLAQPQGNLIVYLLEPESDDGLATWGYFDDSITIGSPFPVSRVLQPTQIRSTPVR